jgi:hypothetical protein
MSITCHTNSYKHLYAIHVHEWQYMYYVCKINCSDNIVMCATHNQAKRLIEMLQAVWKL